MTNIFLIRPNWTWSLVRIQWRSQSLHAFKARRRFQRQFSCGTATLKFASPILTELSPSKHTTTNFWNHIRIKISYWSFIIAGPMCSVRFCLSLAKTGRMEVSSSSSTASKTTVTRCSIWQPVLLVRQILPRITCDHWIMMAWHYQ